MIRMFFMVLLCCFVVIQCSAESQFSYETCQSTCTEKFSSNGLDWNNCIANCNTREKNQLESFRARADLALNAEKKFWDNVIETTKIFTRLGSSVGIIIGIVKFII
jgi:hypothetical protein